MRCGVSEQPAWLALSPQSQPCHDVVELRVLPSAACFVLCRLRLGQSCWSGEVNQHLIIIIQTSLKRNVIIFKKRKKSIDFHSVASIMLWINTIINLSDWTTSFRLSSPPPVCSEQHASGQSSSCLCWCQFSQAEGVLGLRGSRGGVGQPGRLAARQEAGQRQIFWSVRVHQC